MIQLVSVAVVFHFSLIVLSYSSSVAPSSVQTRLLDFVRPYLAVTHFDADGTTLLFASSAATEKKHLLSMSTKASPNDEGHGDQYWVPVSEPGVAGGDRQRRWQRLLATMAELGEGEQGVLAAWLMRTIAIEYPQAKMLRITREPDLMTTTVDDAALPPYTVAIVRSAGGEIRLVQVPPQRLAAPFRGENND